MRILILLVFAVVLAGCGDASKTNSYVLPATPGGRMCVTECRGEQDSCDEICGLAHRRCTQDIQAQALLDYNKYAAEQFASGQEMDLYPRDFERLGPCNAAHDRCSGACEKDYRMCYGKCGGTVDTSSSCQFLCF